MRRLIVNADDFGFTQGVNRAIGEAHRAKVVTSATLMARGAAFEEAVRLARSAPGLSVGCHVVLTGGSPVLAASEIPSLLSGQNSAQPWFRSGWRCFAAAYSGKMVAQEIEAEAIAQIRRLQQSGIKVSHVDTHKHLHLFPHVLAPILRACQACGVNAVRNPFEPVPLGLLSQYPGLWRRWAGIKALNTFAEGFRRAVEAAGMTSPAGAFGVAATGRLDTQLLGYLLEHLPEGDWELVCHPGYDDAELRSMPTRLWAARERELQALTSPETLRLLARSQITLISYADLARI